MPKCLCNLCNDVIGEKSYLHDIDYRKNKAVEYSAGFISRNEITTWESEEDVRTKTKQPAKVESTLDKLIAELGDSPHELELAREVERQFLYDREIGTVTPLERKTKPGRKTHKCQLPGDELTKKQFKTSDEVKCVCGRKYELKPDKYSRYDIGRWEPKGLAKSMPEVRNFQLAKVGAVATPNGVLAAAVIAFFLTGNWLFLLLIPPTMVADALLIFPGKD